MRAKIPSQAFKVIVYSEKYLWGGILGIIGMIFSAKSFSVSLGAYNFALLILLCSFLLDLL